MPRRPIAFATALISLATSAFATPPEVVPHADYQGVIFGSDPGKPELAVYSGIHEVNGKLAVCGIVVIDTKDNSLKRAEKQIARQLTYRFGGEDLSVQTAAFKRYESPEAADAGLAGCWVSRRDWQPAFATMPYEMVGGRVRYTDQ